MSTDTPSTSNPYVGPHGEADREPTRDVRWTDDDLAKASEDVAAWLRLQAVAAKRTAHHWSHGQPTGRTRGYYAAKAYLLECLAFPRRIVLGLPDDASELDLRPGQLVTIPEPDVHPRLLRHYRCPDCSCGVRADHVPGSDDCVENVALRRESITADG